MPDDAVFRALADPTRRRLLDALFERQGQTLSELQSDLPMTRFGVMKHLRVLEASGLVATHRVGREKHHYLDPLPLREATRRWLDRFTGPWSEAIGDLKESLEGAMSEQRDGTRAPAHVLETYIRCTPEQAWEGLTSGAMTRRYFHDTTIHSTWEPGARVEYRMDDGRVAVEGVVIEAERPSRLSFTWHVLYDDAAAAERPSRVTFEIEAMGATTRLRLVHDDFPAGSVVYPSIARGWRPLMDSLKSLVETGEPLAIAGE